MLGEDNVAKYTIRDYIFSDLFKTKKYLMQLYWALHSEDEVAIEDDIRDVTIKYVLTDGIYNDLVFLLRERLVILIESRSQWTPNIPIRVLLYMVQTYHNHFGRINQNLYKSKSATMQTQELYVIYTGEQKNIFDTISLTKDFFEGPDVAIEVKVYESASK